MDCVAHTRHISRHFLNTHPFSCSWALGPLYLSHTDLDIPKWKIEYLYMYTKIVSNQNLVAHIRHRNLIVCKKKAIFYIININFHLYKTRVTQFYFFRRKSLLSIFFCAGNIFQSSICKGSFILKKKIKKKWKTWRNSRGIYTRLGYANNKILNVPLT